jgi:phosphoglycerate dehydrogenase-like enzyme
VAEEEKFEGASSRARRLGVVGLGNVSHGVIDAAPGAAHER